MGITFDAKEKPLKGKLVVPEMRAIGHIDLIGQCAPKYKEDLEASAREYNEQYPKYIHWVIENPRGKKDYGYYLVREKRL